MERRGAARRGLAWLSRAVLDPPITTSNGRRVTSLLKIMSGVIDRKGNDHRSSTGPRASLKKGELASPISKTLREARRVAPFHPYGAVCACP